MSDEQAVVAEAKPQIDWKEFSRLMLFEGIVPCAQYAVKFTETAIDDTTVAVIAKVGEFLLPENKAE
jgi:hypothetical protein